MDIMLGDLSYCHTVDACYNIFLYIIKNNGSEINNINIYNGNSVMYHLDIPSENETIGYGF